MLLLWGGNARKRKAFGGTLGNLLTHKSLLRTLQQTIPACNSLLSLDSFRRLNYPLGCAIFPSTNQRTSNSFRGLRTRGNTHCFLSQTRSDEPVRYYGVVKSSSTKKRCLDTFGTVSILQKVFTGASNARSQKPLASSSVNGAMAAIQRQIAVSCPSIWRSFH